MRGEREPYNPFTVHCTEKDLYYVVVNKEDIGKFKDVKGYDFVPKDGKPIQIREDFLMAKPLKKVEAEQERAENERKKLYKKLDVPGPITPFSRETQSQTTVIERSGSLE